MDVLRARHGMAKIIQPTKDMFSAAQYARENGLSPSTASIRIRKWLIEGEVERAGTGLNNAQYYRIVKK